MGETELRGREPKKEKNLNVSFGPVETSPASSNRTMIPPQSPDSNTRRSFIRRRRTQVAVVKLSWWDCVKGFLFGPKDIQRKLAATTTIEFAEDEDAGEEIFDDKDCPFIVTVSAFPRGSTDVKQCLAPRCMLDTACHQGNIISEDLAKRLGFEEYLPLTQRESNGGEGITGHIHHVKGAIHLSWFHSTSPKTYNDMRFLVSDQANVELVVGAQSILRNNLISPPNLGVTDFTGKSEPEREALRLEQSDLKTKMENLEGTTDPKKQKKLEKWKKEYDDLGRQIQLYDEIDKADIALKRTSTERTKRALSQRAEGLRTELKKYKSKRDDKKTPKKDDGKKKPAGKN